MFTYEYNKFIICAHARSK